MKSTTALRCGSLLEKKHKKSTCTVLIRIIISFCKSNIPVINFIVVSRNMIKVSNNMSLSKIIYTMRVVFTKYFRQNRRFSKFVDEM